jgi:beta-galactosidase
VVVEHLILIVVAFLSGASPSVSEQLEEAERKYGQLKESVTQADGEGIDTSYEKAALKVAELFMGFAAWDAEHPEELAKLLGEWPISREGEPHKFREMPIRELKHTIEVLDRSIEELGRVRENPESRRPARKLDWSEVTIKDGYFTMDDRPAFPGGFTWGGANETVAALGTGIEAVAGFGFSNALDSDGNPNPRVAEGVLERLQKAHAMGIRGTVYLQHNAARWVKEKYPHISDARGHFVSYDIDHPAVRELWSKAIAAVVPALKEYSDSTMYLLANEPAWDSNFWTDWARKNIGVPTKYTMAKYQKWLEESYGSIEKLNQSWNTDFPEFKDISSTPESRDNPAQWYDWCRFNQVRVTDWFDFLAREIRKHDPNAACYAKFMTRTFDGSLDMEHGIRNQRCPWHHDGIDREAMARAFRRVNGCDAGISPASDYGTRSPWSDYSRYAQNWIGQCITFGFLSSIAPDKPIYDGEWHAVSHRTIDTPAEHINCALWLSYLHGLGGNSVWYWGRLSNNSPNPRSSASWFHGSLLTKPQLLNAYAQTLLEVNSCADEIVALAKASRPIRILYSEASAIQSVEYLDAQLAAYEALYFLGEQIGFVTESMMQEGHPQGLQWLIVPNNNYVEDDTVEALREYVRTGGKILVVGDQALRYDPHGQERDSSQTAFLKNLPNVKPGKLEAMFPQIEEQFKASGIARPVRCVDKAGNTALGVRCRSIEWETGRLVSLVNMRSSPAVVSLELDGTTVTNARDLLRNRNIDTREIHVASMDVLLLLLGL